MKSVCAERYDVIHYKEFLFRSTGQYGTFRGGNPQNAALPSKKQPFFPNDFLIAIYKR